MQKKLILRAFDLIEQPDGPNKHFSFIVRKNQIISEGWNSCIKTHPITIKWKFPWKYRHSELHAIINFPDSPSFFKKCKFYNVRVNRLGEIGMSKPCRYCLPMLLSLQFKELWYTKDGVWKSV